MNFLRKTIGLILVFAVFLAVIPSFSLSVLKSKAAWISDWGSCGDNVTWTLDTEGILTISGSGEMTKYPIIDKNNPFNLENSPFYDNDSIVAVIIEEGVITIGDNAFSCCDGIADLTIPNTVRRIGGGAFKECTSLTAVNIPGSVTKIGVNPFSGCSSLSSISVENDNAVFHADGNCLIETKTKTMLIGCKNSIIPKDGSVTTIVTDAFKGCTSLESLTIPFGVSSIERYAFSGCTTLSSITIPGSIKTIEEYVFNGCVDLKNVTILNGVINIENNVFRDCTSLVSISIPDSITSIGYYAFWGCDLLMDVFYSGTKDQWEKMTIQNGNDALFSALRHYGEIPPSTEPATIMDSGTCGDSLTWTLDSNGLLVISGNGNMDDYSSRTKNTPFYRNGEIFSVIIKEGVTSIGRGVFYGCHSLKSVTIPDSVASIADYAFCYCSELTQIIIPGSVKSIGNSAFAYCNELISVNISKGVTMIGPSAFECCVSLTNITIPDSVIKIGINSFRKCISLKSITISDSITSIGYDAFNETAFFDDSSNWMDNALYIGKHLIKANEKIEGDYTIKNGTLCIADKAFYDCTNLNKVIMPNSVISVGFAAFGSCTKLTDVTFSTSLTSIGHHAFYGCFGLTSLTIPEGVKCIEESAFSCCSGLLYVTLPKSLTSILNFAFNECNSIAEVYYSATESQWNAVSIKYGNDALTKAKIHFLDDSMLPTESTKVTQLDKTILPEKIFNFDGDDISSAETLESIKIASASALTKSQLVAVITGADNAVVTVKDTEGNELANDATLGTGSTVTVTLGDVSVTKTIILMGDVDGDGTVNATDARLALRAAAKLDVLEGAFASAADTDGDNNINATDARGILRAAAKLDVLKVA